MGRRAKTGLSVTVLAVGLAVVLLPRAAASFAARMAGAGGVLQLLGFWLLLRELGLARAIELGTEPWWVHARNASVSAICRSYSWVAGKLRTLLKRPRIVQASAAFGATFGGTADATVTYGVARPPRYDAGDTDWLDWLVREAYRTVDRLNSLRADIDSGHKYLSSQIADAANAASTQRTKDLAQDELRRSARAGSAVSQAWATLLVLVGVIASTIGAIVA